MGKRMTYMVTFPINSTGKKKRSVGQFQANFKMVQQATTSLQLKPVRLVSFTTKTFVKDL